MANQSISVVGLTVLPFLFDAMTNWGHGKQKRPVDTKMLTFAMQCSGAWDRTSMGNSLCLIKAKASLLRMYL